MTHRPLTTLAALAAAATFMTGLALSAHPASQRLRSLFARAEIAGLPAPHGLTFSMGAAELSPDDVELDAFIARADRPLYEAKAAGRNLLRLAA